MMPFMNGNPRFALFLVLALIALATVTRGQSVGFSASQTR